MRISSIDIENYKVFKGKHHFDFNGGLIFLVGENNTGKSTLLDAINFVKSGLPKEKKINDIKNKFANQEDHVVCKMKLTGNIREVINDFSEKKYERYVFDENGTEAILIQRSSEEKTIKQGDRDVKLDIKKVTIWNPEAEQFENPFGVDVVNTLFETQFIWADTNPQEIADFGSTKICGRLLNEAIGDFFDSEQWKKFVEVHKETFCGTEDSLGKRAKRIEEGIKEVLNSQYGVADIKFDFSLPETATFYKTGDIIVDDGTNTRLEEKGTGMQRAVALAIIQVYAQSLTIHPSDPKKTRPLFLFIDEPEICLHPRAQYQLLDALVEISKVRQIFVSTHSPYLLKQFKPSIHDLIIFNKEGNLINATPASSLNLFPWSPSLCEINYKAYQLYTVEFHNELYGYIQGKEKLYTEKNTEKYFVLNGCVQSKVWIPEKNGITLPPQRVTMMTFIRNKIHHPENKNNQNYSQQELKDSIEKMIELILLSKQTPALGSININAIYHTK